MQREPEKGEIKLLLPVSMRGQCTDDEIIGMIAHELGHLSNQFHHGESFEVYSGHRTTIEEESDADEAAKDLGLEKEILAIRAKVPLPEAS